MNMETLIHLSTDEVTLLRQTIRSTTASLILKRRCQCLLYCFHGLSITELTTFFHVPQRTIYTWLEQWEKGRLSALLDEPGRSIQSPSTVSYPSYRQSEPSGVRPISPATLRQFISKEIL